MQNIDLLELGGDGKPFTYRVGGQVFTAPDPRDLSYQTVLAILRAEHLPGTPSMPHWQPAVLFERWSAHYDLPDFPSSQRLAYLIDHYRSAIAYDLGSIPHEDLGALWRARRWRYLLDLIDHLPGHSWYASSVAMDPEHARMMAESLAARSESGEKDASGPPLNTWTPEMAKLTDIFDAVRYVSYAVIAAQAGKKAGPPPKPSPRPVTPLESAMKHAEYDRRKTAHEALVARMLPHKAKSTG